MFFLSHHTITPLFLKGVHFSKILSFYLIYTYISIYYNSI